MMKFITYIHVYLIQTILNFLPFCWIDIFYDNQTYIGNQLHHPIYLFLWAFSSAIGFYYYSKKIWEKYNVNYNKKNHVLICLGMILSCNIPYNDITLLKDLHVWLSILFVACFILEWFLYIPVHLNKNSILFFINIGLSFVSHLCLATLLAFAKSIFHLLRIFYFITGCFRIDLFNLILSQFFTFHKIHTISKLKYFFKI